MRRRRILKLLFAFGVLLSLTAILAWCFPRQLLTVDSGPVNADVMVVLGGGSHERPERATELFKEGGAPRIICSGSGDCYFNKERMVKAGVAAELIQTESKSQTTKENAEFTVKMLRELGAKRVIIVTSWYHSRRALNCFRHYGPEIEFYSRPSYFGYAPADWKPKGIARYVRSEYLKLPGYWLRYGVCPF